MSSERSLSILLVDDDDGIRTIASLLLEAEGHRVHAVPSGEEASEWLKHNRPDVLVADVNMPGGMGGVELARIARLADPALPILLASGEAVPDPAWIAAGGHYLNKPYDRRALLTAIEAATTVAA